MPNELPGSKMGEGIGGKVQVTRDPNSPTFDPAEKLGATEQKIAWLVANERVKELSSWELSFLSDVYGRSPMTRAMHIKVAKIFKKHWKP